MKKKVILILLICLVSVLLWQSNCFAQQLGIATTPIDSSAYSFEIGINATGMTDFDSFYDLGATFDFVIYFSDWFGIGIFSGALFSFSSAVPEIPIQLSANADFTISKDLAFPLIFRIGLLLLPSWGLDFYYTPIFNATLATGVKIYFGKTLGFRMLLGCNFLTYVSTPVLLFIEIGLMFRF